VDVFAGAIQVLLSFGTWFIFSLSAHVIGNKLRHPAPWLAWIPIANLFYFMDLAGRSPWMALLLFVPIVNIFVYAVMFGDIADRLNMPTWLGWCMLLPVANVFILPYLAASGTSLGRPDVRGESAFERASAPTS
jgi:hypothetical protein